MAGDRILITASLAPDSESTIISDLDRISASLNARGIGLQITCRIDDNSLRNIQNQLNNITRNLNLNIGNNARNVNAVTNLRNNVRAVSEIVNQAPRSFANVTNILADVENAFRSLHLTQEQIRNVSIIDTTNKNGGIQAFTARITDSTNATRDFQYELQKAKDGVSSFVLQGTTGNNSGSFGFFAKQAREAEAFYTRLRELNNKYTDPNAARPITGSITYGGGITQTRLGILADEYDRVINAVDNFRNANTITYDELKQRVNQAISNYKTLAENLRNQSTQATRLRAKTTDQLRVEQLQKIDEFIAKVSNSSVQNIDGIINRANNLRNALSAENFNPAVLRTFLDGFSQLKNEFSTANEQARGFTSLRNEIESAVKSLSKFENSSIARANSNNAGVTAQINTNQNLINALNELSTFVEPNMSVENIQRIRQALNNLTPDIQQAVQQSEELSHSLRNTSGETTRIAELKKLQSQLKIFANANQGAVQSTQLMSNGRTFAEEYQRLVNLVNSNNLDKNGINQLAKDIRNFRLEAKATGLTSSKFFADMGNQLKTLVNRWVSLYAIIGKIRTMVNYVTELDTAMTKVKRVTNETATGYENFLVTSAQTAQKTHTTLIDTVEQATKWAKSGFNAKQSALLAETSLIYSKVADVDNETAVNDMITALKGFDIQVDKSLSIVDKLDKLNNNYATDAKSLGEGLRVSASAMHNSGNDINQTLAMIAGGAEITQNAREMGQALKIFAFRIRGMKGEIEELGEEAEGIESISKTQTQILNLTKNAVNIFNDNGEFRNTYEILRDISGIWNELSSTNQSSLTEILFGKNRANQGLSIIKAFQSGQIEKMYQDSVNSAGTATAEMEILSNSIESHITDMKNALQVLSTDFIKSDFLKGSIDTGKTIVNIVDWLINNIGSLGTVITTVATIASVKGAGIVDFMQRLEMGGLSLNREDVAALRQYNALIGNGVSTAQAQATALGTVSAGARQLAVSANGAAVSETILAQAENKVTIGAKAAAVAQTLLNTALNTGLFLAISFAITQAVNGIKDFVKAEEQAREIAFDNAETYQEEAKNLQDIKSSYLGIAGSTKDLTSAKEQLESVQDKINEKYKAEKENIDLLNNSIGENIRLLTQREKAESEQYVKENKSNYDKAVEKLNEQHNVNFSNNSRGTAYGFDRGFSRFSDKEYEAFEKLNLKNFVNAKGTGWKDEFFLTGTKQEILDSLIAIRDTYQEIDGYDTKTATKLNKSIKELQAEISQYKTIIDEYENALGTAGLENVSDDIVKMTDKMKSKYEEYQTAVERGSFDTASVLKQDIYNLKSNIDSVIGDTNSAYKNSVNELFQTFDFDDVKISDVASALNETFKTFFDDTFTNSLKNIDNVENALNDLLEGKNLSSDTAWNLFDLDTDRILTDIRLVNGEYSLSYEQLYKLKEQLIKKQKEEIIVQKQASAAALETARNNLTIAKAELARLIRNGVNSSGDEKVIAEQKRTVQDIIDDIHDGENSLKKYNILINELNSRLNITSKITEKAKSEASQLIEAIDKSLKEQTKNIDETVKELNKQKDSAEKALEAEEKNIDLTVKDLENEKKAIESAKSELEEQLEILEQQQDEIEQIIDDYKTVASVVSDYADSEVDKIKELSDERKNYYDEQIQKSEEYYDNQIASLKAVDEQKKEEQELNEKRLAITEKQVALEEKIADLNKAKNNKVRVYSSARGWNYEVNQEEVAKAKKEVEEAQKNLSSAEKDYSDTIAANQFEKQIEGLEKQKQENTKLLEAQRDTEIAGFEQQITALEEYTAEWEKAAESIQNEEKELLATKILGSNWREKITNKDISLLNQYSNSYHSYNNQLKSLTEGEITMLKNSIKERENEISSIENQITYWNDYKQTVQENSKAITDNIDEQINYWNEVKNTVEEDAQNMKDTLNDYLDYLSDYNNGVNNAYYNSEVNLWNFKEHYKQYIDEMISKNKSLLSQTQLIKTAFQSTADELPQENFVEKFLADRLRSISDRFAEGGVSTRTGFAWLDGTANSPETIFNAKDSAKLYNMVHNTPNLMTDIFKRAIPVNAVMSNQDRNSGNFVMNVDKIVADNPPEFIRQLDGYMEQYWKIKSTESKVYR